MDQNWRNFLVTRVDFEIVESLLAIRLEKKMKKLSKAKKFKKKKKEIYIMSYLETTGLSYNTRHENVF